LPRCWHAVARPIPLEALTTGSRPTQAHGQPTTTAAVGRGVVGRLNVHQESMAAGGATTRAAAAGGRGSDMPSRLRWRSGILPGASVGGRVTFGMGRESHSAVQGLTADRRSQPTGREVIFAAHGDEPVGLDGPRVEFDDERAVLNAGVVLVATLATFLRAFTDVSSAWKRPGGSTRSVCACRKRLARRSRRAWPTIEGYPQGG
jgi:hypothetical protein